MKSKNSFSQIIVRFGWLWTSFSLIIFSLWGYSPNQERSVFYRLFTGYVLGNVPVLFSSIACFRSSLKDSTAYRISWILMGISLFFYMMGNLWFTSWDIVFHLDPTGSLGDPFFVLFYFLMTLSILTALFLNKVKIYPNQWKAVIIIAIFIAIGTQWIISLPVTNIISLTEKSTQLYDTNPTWIMMIDNSLKPYGSNFNILYAIADVILLILSTILILKAQQGKVKSWRIIAQGLASFYIADIWFAYASSHISNYQTGFILEVFWAIGAAQFGIAASLYLDEQKLS
jgi:hypothetical protein